MAQKKETKRNGIIFLSVYLFTIVFGANLLELLQSAFVDRNLNFVCYSALFLMAVVLFYPYLWKKIKSLKFRNFLLLFFIGFFSFIAVVIVEIIISQLRIINLNAQDIIQAEKESPVLLAITAIFIGPFVEEMVYRFCIFSFFPSKKILATIISVFCFSFVHVWSYVIIEGNFSQLIAALVYVPFAIGICILYIKTENIWYPIIMHSVINALLF